MASDLRTTDEDALDELTERVVNNGNDRKRRLSQSNDDQKTREKRSKLSEPNDAHHGMNQLPLLRQLDLPVFNLTSASHSSQNPSSRPGGEATEDTNSNEWHTIENGRAKKQTKKIPRKDSDNYPRLEFSQTSRLQSQIKISDIQSLVLYILADGNAPQFISVSHRPSIRKVVVLMVPGLEHSMFNTKGIDSNTETRDRQDNRGRYSNYTSPDEYYPTALSADELSTPLKPLAEMFPHVWPVKAPGDDRMGKMHSPLHAMLTAPLPKDKEDKKKDNQRKGARPAKTPPGWKNTRTRVTEFVHSPEELLENEYVVHPASYSTEPDKQAWEAYRGAHGTSTTHGWVDTQVNHWDDGDAPEKDIQLGSITAGREMLAKPEKPITNYLTQ
jgi:RNA exonuclease 1